MEYKVDTLLPVKFEKIENPSYLDDSRWQMYKVWICHDLENYNGSYFDVHVLRKMGERLAGIPVVGYISSSSTNEVDFNGHEEKLVIQNGDINIEYLGRAYGCVLENNNWKIEQKQHEDGSIRNYLTCNCIIWNMFNDAIEIFKRDEKKSQSMELQSDSIIGKFEKDGYYHFEDATIRALCILGEGIPPAMAGSVIEKFSLTDSIQTLLKEVNESIKQFSIQSQSSNEVDNINKGGIEVENENEIKTEEVVEETTIVDEETVSTENTEEFEKVSEEVNKESDINFESISQDYENKIADLKNQIENLKTDYSKLEEETISLREFKLQADTEKRQVKETELFSQYEEDLKDVSEFTALKENSKNFSINDLEKELALMYVKNKANFSLNKNNSTIKIKVEHKEETNSPYGNYIKE